MEFKDFAGRAHQLPADQREALVLVGASGFSYEEAAEHLRRARSARSRAASTAPGPAWASFSASRKRRSTDPTG